MKKGVFIGLLLLGGVLFYTCSMPKEEKKPVEVKADGKPKIVNIINFIRLLEPRSKKITEDVLYQTVVKQLEMMQEYNLRGTFLLQYDALLDSSYQSLLKSLPDSLYEIGGWFEIPQPLVENAGIKWRGRYPWDWHADVGFSTGYSPEEREKLVDVYMEDFKEIFGYFPKSMGCWFIDAHSLKYMYDKYGIVASCNCKDQIGTDGYTMWGGYWNQGYYASVKNAYMPAQNYENQISVPIFRMLGSDPIHQYDNGLGTSHQGVVSLEPVYGDAGGDSTWVNWFFKHFVEGECLEYNYVQVGQENSFTWNNMKKGFEIQIPLLAQLRDEKKIKVETLSESGEWFSKKYKITPATSVTALNDLSGSNQKTVWFNSRFYRSNLLWDNGTLRFRDIHIFDEDMASSYLTERAISNQCIYFTLPFVDGYCWSSAETTAGLWFKAEKNRQEILLNGEKLTATEAEDGTLIVVWKLDDELGTFSIHFDENSMRIDFEGDDDINWYLALNTAENRELPFSSVNGKKVELEFENIDYEIIAEKGKLLISEKYNILQILPDRNSMVLNLSGVGI
ncbi:hypothetical protein [uncultured Sunxiuqinia sp.]|uniref:hypothetical protein n=1 Tax=uncultured Sunxiuqinia sp. TaxID=1573825 RepID=UPI002AA6DF73|nr:hypothetical protein [uncultured Sunxiuqinia sp.]